MLAEFGEVVVVALPRNRESGRPRGFAFIDMATPEDVQAAIAGMDGRLFNGRVLRATPSVPKEDQPKRTDTDNGMGKMYVGNLAFETTKEELVDFFAEYGTVFEVYMPTNRETGEIRGFGFVNMKKDEIESVIEQTNGLEMNGRTLTVMMPLTKGEKAPRKARTQRTKIYVGNLSFYTVQETLEEVFSEFGEIVDCYIPPDPATGQSRGFGFVTMSPEDAQSAIAELDSCELDGRIIRVNEAQPKGGKRDEEPESDDSEGSADE
jgi:RNA recognition motif-containing protein